MQRRLWITIVNNETAEQGVKRGRNAALICAGLFGLFAIDAWWFFKGDGAPVAAFFAALYVFAAWRIHRGSAELMDLAMICLPLGVVAIWRDPVMQPGGYWYRLAPFFLLLFGFDLLNGVRGVSYLHAPLGLPRRGGESAEGGRSVPLEPRSPLRPQDARASDPA